MSYVVMPDPHPGRCKNLRPNGPPKFGMRRCLEAEGKRHVCRFEPQVRGVDSAQGRVFSRERVSPERWEVPPP